MNVNVTDLQLVSKQTEYDTSTYICKYYGSTTCQYISGKCMNCGIMQCILAQAHLTAELSAEIQNESTQTKGDEEYATDEQYRSGNQP